MYQYRNLDFLQVSEKWCKYISPLTNSDHFHNKYVHFTFSSFGILGLYKFKDTKHSVTILGMQNDIIILWFMGGQEVQRLA